MNRRLRPLVATALMLAGGAAAATVIEGEVVFPSHHVPALKAYVCELDTSRIKTVAIARDAGRFSVEVPPGRYVVFLAPNEPGAPDIYGAYTEYSLCMAQRSDPEHGPAAACETHALVTVNVAGKSAHAAVRIDDWYLTDDIAAELDKVRGLETTSLPEPLGAPRFSEYPVPQQTLAVPKLDFSDSPLTPEERSLVQKALTAGPNFAAQTTLTQLPCGAGCQRILLVDWRTGKISAPQFLAAVQGSLPCRSDEAVQFRTDSLLLEVTRPRPGGVVTRYYLWKPEAGSIVLTTEYQRDEVQFCGVPPP